MLLRRCMLNYVGHVLGTKHVKILEHLQSNFTFFLSAAVIMVTMKINKMRMEACCILSFIRILVLV